MNNAKRMHCIVISSQESTIRDQCNGRYRYPYRVDNETYEGIRNEIRIGFFNTCKYDSTNVEALWGVEEV